MSTNSKSDPDAPCSARAEAFASLHSLLDTVPSAETPALTTLPTGATSMEGSSGTLGETG